MGLAGTVPAGRPAASHELRQRIAPSFFCRHRNKGKNKRKVRPMENGNSGFCGNCGEPIADGAAFCGQCGASVSGEEAPPASNLDFNAVSPGKAKLAMWLHVTAFLFYAAGVADFVLGRFFKIDFTGISWSPIAFGIVGSLFTGLAEKISPDDGEQEK